MASKKSLKEQQNKGYTIKPELIEAQGRSVGTIVGGRLCQEAIDSLENPSLVSKMSFKDLKSLARKECIQDSNYLSAQAPILETVFKVLLSAPNDTLSEDELHGTINELWMNAISPRHISLDALSKVITRDSYYGIVKLG